MTDLTEVFNRLAAARRVVVDVETSGLDWKRNHIVGYVLTFGPAPEDSHYLPVRHAPGGNIKSMDVSTAPQASDSWTGNQPDWERLLLVRLSDPNLIIVGHNLSFDLKFLYRASCSANIFAPRFEDTMINAALIDELQGKFSLEFCAGLTGAPAKKSREIEEHICSKFSDVVDTRGAMGHFWRLRGDDPKAVEYATGDGTSTWAVCEWQWDKLNEQGLSRVWDVECRLIPVLARMSTRGIKISEDRLAWLGSHVDARLKYLYSKMPDGFNARSAEDVRQWCEANGETGWPLTEKKRQPSFPEAWLETHLPGQAIVAIRKLEVLRSSFIIPMRDTHLWNGRVHAEFNQLRGDEYGTITGRLSSSHPNLQAVPKRNKEIGRLFRSIFVPDEGQIYGSVDFVQCEPRLLAYYSRCKVLVDDYLNNPKADAHQAVADATGFDRDTGKRINQTLLTGGGKGVLISKYKMSPADVDRIWADYFRRMPEIQELQSKAKYLMRKRGYIVSLLGRRSRLPHSGKAHVATNRILQCGNADILKLKMVEIDDYLASMGHPIDMLNNVHDALDFQFAEEHRSSYEECQRIMCDFGEGAVIKLDIPMALDVGEGRNWAEASYGPEKVVSPDG